MPDARAPHAVLDLESRRLKAIKIERLLGLHAIGRSRRLRLLEVGTGSGGIAHYFGTAPHLDIDVTAVDVIDQRQVIDGYRFLRVDGTSLPFDDAAFDIVLSNHVIEHVGDADTQLHHLREIARMIDPDGMAYIAVPNRWMLVEPHYRLAFLSWLPRDWRSRYLRLTGKGAYYDCAPLTLAEFDSLLERAGLQARHVETEALRWMLELERARTPSLRLADHLPDRFVDGMRPIMPTLICIARRSQR